MFDYLLEESIDLSKLVEIKSINLYTKIDLSIFDKEDMIDFSFLD